MPVVPGGINGGGEFGLIGSRRRDRGTDSPQVSCELA